MAQIYLHIGAPKTATSSLQHLLAANPAVLDASGLVYPDTCRGGDAHHALACDLLAEFLGQEMPQHWYGPIERGSSWRLLREQLEQLPGNAKVILSSELFFGADKRFLPAMDWMAGQLRRHELRIVVYLRRQDQLYSSFYNQDVKGIRRYPHDAYRFYEDHRLFDDSYHARLQLWSSVFGSDSLIVRAFEREQLPGGSLVEDFCSVIGLKGLAGSGIEKNTGLGPVQLHVKRCLNRAGLDAARNDEVVRLLEQICPEEPMPEVRFINARYFDRLAGEWREDNQRVAEDFRQGKPLFTQPVPTASDLERYKVRGFNLSVYVELMLRHFGAGHSPELRQLFARATLLAIVELNLWGITADGKGTTLLAWAGESG